MVSEPAQEDNLWEGCTLDERKELFTFSKAVRTMPFRSSLRCALSV